MSAIEFRSVDKIYRGRRVINALSFMIEAGERIVLFGPSGCGKSTTLLLIAGLVAPDAGEIRIDGKVVSTAGRIHVGPAVARRRDGVSGSCALAGYERCRKYRLRTSRPAFSESRMQAAHKRHRKPCRAWRLFGRAAGRTLRRRVPAWPRPSRARRRPCLRRKIYRGRRVINALSFMIEAGQRIVLFGPSGCGKSTTLLLIAGLVAPDAGEIRIDGKVVSTAGRIHAAPQSRVVGMVFQDLALWPHMRVAENIGFGLRARRVPSSECRQRISDIAKLVGLGDYLDVRPANSPAESASVASTKSSSSPTMPSTRAWRAARV